MENNGANVLLLLFFYVAIFISGSKAKSAGEESPQGSTHWESDICFESHLYH